MMGFVALDPSCQKPCKRDAWPKVFSGGDEIAELLQILFLLLVARRKLEQPRGGAAEDVVLALLRQERQVPDRRRQIEIPVRIVGGVEQLRFRVDHAERGLHRVVILNLHRLRRVIHVAHIIRRLLFQQRAFRRPQHVFVIEPLHQERNPGEARFHPHHRQFRESLADAVDHPIGAIEHVVPGEAERVRGDEAVAAGKARLAPIDAGMEGDDEAALLHRPIDFHIGIVVHAHVGAHGGDHEAADMLPVAEGLDVAQRRGRIGKRQAEQRKETPARFRHHLLGEPAVIGPAQLDLHFLLRMQADIEHAGREQAGIIDAHRVHPAMAELHVADLCRRRFSRSSAADSA